MKLKTLIKESEIEKRVKEIAKKVEESFNGDFIIISLLKGAFIFTADLIKHIERQVEIDFMKVKSYKGKKSQELQVELLPKANLKGKEVLIVDEILDSGQSLKFAKEWVQKEGAKSVKTCVLLEKEKEKPIKADIVGFKIPDQFVVGYGLDLNEKFRNLPYIAKVEGEEG